MDAGLATIDQRRAPASSRAYMRNQLLQSDIGNIDITKEKPINQKIMNGSEWGHPPTMMEPVMGPQGGVPSNFYGGPARTPVPYRYQGQAPGRDERLKMAEAGSSRKSSMNSSQNTFSNFFKGKYRKMGRGERYEGDALNEEDDNFDLSGHGSSILTFNDISSMRNNGGHAYGYGGHMDDTSPIIPTLVTQEHNSMNNTEYRKHVMAQRKMAFNNIAKQQQQQSDGPAGPRTMSLQNYHQRPVMRPGPMGPSKMGPPNSSRMNSLMNGPNPMMGRQGYPPMVPGPTNDPRAMSLGGKRPVMPFGVYTAPNGPVRSPVGPEQLAPDGPRTMSLQNQRAPQDFSGAWNRQKDSEVRGYHQFRPAAPSSTQSLQHNGATTPGSSASYNSMHSENLGPSRQESHTPPTAEESNNAPELPRSPTKTHLSALATGELEDNQTIDSGNDVSNATEEGYSHDDSTDYMVKLNVLTLSGSAKQDMELRNKERDQTEQKDYHHSTTQNIQTESYDSEIPKNSSHDLGLKTELNETGYGSDINLNPSKALTSTVEDDSSIISTNYIDTNRISVQTNGHNTAYKKPYQSSNGSVVNKSESVPKRLPRNSSPSKNERHESVTLAKAEPEMKRSGSTFFGAKKLLMKLKSSKGTDRSSSVSSAQSSRRSFSSTFEPENDTFRGKTPTVTTNNERRKSYNSLYSNTSSGIPGTFDFHNNSLNGIKEELYDTSDNHSLQIRKSMIIGESTQIQDSTNGTIAEQTLKTTAYVPSFASSNDPKQPLLVSSEQIDLLTKNHALMQELQLLSIELAESIARETRLEKNLQEKLPEDFESTQALSLVDFETELRKKSSTIVKLIQELNEERLKRFIAEEQNLLHEHGNKPSQAELVRKIDGLKQELATKDILIEQLRTQINKHIE